MNELIELGEKKSDTGEWNDDDFKHAWYIDKLNETICGLKRVYKGDFSTRIPDSACPICLAIS